jgi:hypothetical protein
LSAGLADARDRRVLVAAAAHGGLALALAAGPPGGPLAICGLALAMCWSANTVSHIHLHKPLFRARWANTLFSLYLTLLLGIPQGHWRRRHLRHHGLDTRAGGVGPAPRYGSRTGAVGVGLAPANGPGDPRGLLDLAEVAALLVALAALGVVAPERLLGLWAPAIALGMALCALQGRGEHLHAPGVDHRGSLYNLLWFNDGYHAAHHRDPDLHWTALRAKAQPADRVSRWPPVLRWVEESAAAANRVQAWTLDRLERLALRLECVRRLLMRTHEPALRALLAHLGPVGEVVIVGGGLFPRSALLLGRLLPAARLTILDRGSGHLTLAAAAIPPWLRPRVRLLCAHFDAGASIACDLLVVPLAFRGDRARLYREPPAPAVLVHDWIWRRRGSASARVSLALGKRLNLVVRSSPVRPSPGNLCSASRPEEPAPCYRPICSRDSARATTLPS